MRDLTTHIQHFLPLLGVFIACIIGFIVFSYDNTFRMTIIGATAVAYVVWGVVHHHIHNNLYLSVVLEYIAVAALGVIISLSILYWT